MSDKDWRLGFVGFIGFLNAHQIWDYFNEGIYTHAFLNLLPFLFFIYFIPSKKKR